MHSFSFINRQENIDKIKSNLFDIAVVGGGITGAGVAREAALRGLKVCVLEQSDFASGTSSRSSKLAHGGLRYLENLEFDLVAEALNERQHLLEMASHMVHPLPFLIPMYKGDRVSWIKMKCGMILYDVLVGLKAPKLHRSVSKAEILQDYPSIKSEGLIGGFLYYDALMDDDRLVLETLRSAGENGVESVSYVKVKGFDFTENKTQLDCVDALSNVEFKVQAKHVVSCVGPWTDDLANMVTKSWTNRMRPSKGVHLCIPKNILNLKTALVMAADKSSRILFCIPRDDFDIIGTTDTDYKDNPENVSATVEDIEYIIKVLKDYYPDVKLTEEDVISTYAGVRPLVNDGSENESKVSRSHWINTDTKNRVTYISGGKYTTYLAMAKDTVDDAIKNNKQLKNASPCSDTIRRKPFVLENNYRNDALAHKKIEDFNLKWTQEEKEEFVKKHGAQAIKFLKNYLPHKSYIEFEALISIHEYFCGSIEDLYKRRTSWFLGGRYLSKTDLQLVAEVFKEELALPNAEIDQQIKNTLQNL